MADFATIDDVNTIWRQLKSDEVERAKMLLSIVSDSLREEADKVGKNLDRMIEEKPPYFKNVVKSVTVDIVARTLMTSTDQEPMTQTTESALGYSFSGSYLVPGGGLFIKNSELSRIGLKKQRYGVIDFYGPS
ncbi:phage Gp19/Gp15/Gp42 family protein [Lactococcus formosensis]|uniref:phage Gp19/Gp15/Gp42 family protein n=1 Tax=Lactococcus formosensis TaxID=1281486 RepID=UPI0024350CE8|nr:phage Gp19/Gp15/Gp42 family protein [Lactococcus formosensis]MDG6113753.1 phage Gp19/Gp15/Gp42 family protein [Lactococcus formosensis]MDG6122256.1 phage Gp19/Gp15/Gp42 family protein [Lactococcus formosensis]MDG6151862.1 phage Gp19/Gp15/Gp42 family protein [Lactococcus formosensis]MDG6174918.1 phage Gp19/Gp15/Gp42 family protein [Lactococcus formosensis]MDG6181236.1 phage Gp19/Gp15/Gp42 family protein [Lactococcus formosensis]